MTEPKFCQQTEFCSCGDYFTFPVFSHPSDGVCIILINFNFTSDWQSRPEYYTQMRIVFENVQYMIYSTMTCVTAAMFVLPQCNSKLYKNSFINHCLDCSRSGFITVLTLL